MERQDYSKLQIRKIKGLKRSQNDSLPKDNQEPSARKKSKR